MPYTEEDVTSLLAKLGDLDLAPGEAEVLAEIVRAASGADSEVEGFGSRNEMWKPMVQSLIQNGGNEVIAGHVGSTDSWHAHTFE